MNSARVFFGVVSTLIVVFLVAGHPARSADPAPAKPAVTGDVVAYEEGKSITIEVGAGTSAGRRKLEFAIVKDKTEIKLLGDAKALKVGMDASIWTGKGTSVNKAVATRIEAWPHGAVLKEKK